MKTLHYFQHVPYEAPGTVLEWAQSRNWQTQATRFHEADSQLPSTAAIDFLVIMGGPMGVHDTIEHPWLATEKNFIKSFIDTGKPVLGICLGAQLLADAMGAEVFQAPHSEIGWAPLVFSDEFRFTLLGKTLPTALTAFHWHGDTFSLPVGSIPVGHTEGCARQGFWWNEQVLGLQFHLEATPPMIAQMCQEGKADLQKVSPYVQTAAQIAAKSEKECHLTRAALFGLLDAWLG